MMCCSDLMEGKSAVEMPTRRKHAAALGSREGRGMGAASDAIVEGKIESDDGRGDVMYELCGGRGVGCEMAVGEYGLAEAGEPMGDGSLGLFLRGCFAATDEDRSTG